MKIKKIIFFLVVFVTLNAQAQYDRKAGSFELGIRNTLSVFGNNGTYGFGTGAHFRIMVAKKINTEWFADYIQSDLYNMGKRVDGHIGWSVMFYLLDNPKKFDPYLIAGHCFDYTKIKIYNSLTEVATSPENRWSSAAQAGLGTHYYLGKRFNLTLACQYMLHLANDIHIVKTTTNGIETLTFEQPTSNSKLTFEGHMLISLSLNFKIGNLW